MLDLLNTKFRLIKYVLISVNTVVVIGLIIQVMRNKLDDYDIIVYKNDNLYITIDHGDGFNSNGPLEVSLILTGIDQTKDVNVVGTVCTDNKISFLINSYNLNNYKNTLYMKFLIPNQYIYVFKITQFNSTIMYESVTSLKLPNLIQQ